MYLYRIFKKISICLILLLGMLSFPIISMDNEKKLSNPWEYKVLVIDKQPLIEQYIYYPPVNSWGWFTYQNPRYMEVIEKQIGFNPIYLHGFDMLHEQGIKGRGVKLAFVETGVDPSHPEFSTDQVTIVDCSHHTKKNVDFNRLGIRLGDEENSEHGNHVMGVALSQHKVINVESCFYSSLEQTEKDNCNLNDWNVRYWMAHPGGCVPESTGILYKFSASYYTGYKKVNGTSIFSVAQILSMPDLNDYRGTNNKKPFLNEYTCEFQSALSYYSELTPSLTSEELNFLITTPIDRSFIEAIEKAIQGPAYVINISYTPLYILNPLDSYKAPEWLLNDLADLLEKNDKVIIWCAGNDFSCMEQHYANKFFEQILNHKILSQRMIFAINVCPTTNDNPNKIGALTIKDDEIPFELYYSSNWPGRKFKDICLSAMGSCIFSGEGKNNMKWGYMRGSGTSESAPIITSLVALVKEKFPELTMVEALQRVKNTAKSLGDTSITGCGYVWAPAALGLESNYNN